MIWRAAAVVCAALVALTIVPAVRHLRETPPPDRPAVRLVLPPPEGAEFGRAVDEPPELAFAPSGDETVFVATTDGRARLWRRPLDGQRAEPLAGTEGAALPAYAPDGQAVWFFAGGRLRRVDLQSGGAADLADAPSPAGVAPGPNDVVLFAPGPAGALKRLAAGTITDATVLRPGERRHAFPSWAGDDAFVYLAIHEDGRRVLRLRDAADDVELRRADSHGVFAQGHLLYVRERTLLAEPFELEERRLGPRGVTLASDVAVAPSGRGAFAASDRVLAAAAGRVQPRVLQWFGADGTPRNVVAEPGDYWQVRLSPDERRIAVTQRDPLMGTLDVLTVPSEGGPLTRVTLAVAADTDPVWSPDGRRVAFRSWQDGQPHIYARPVAPLAASAADEPIWRSPLDEVPSDWTPAALLFHARSPETGQDVWSLPAGARTPVPLARSGFNEADARVSPDGRLLAYASDESGAFDVYVAPVKGDAPRVRVSTAGGQRPQWLASSRGLIFRRGDTLLRADLSFDGGSGRASVPAPLVTLPHMRDYAVTGDGRRVLAILPADPGPPPAVRVVVGWQALLRVRS